MKWFKQSQVKRYNQKRNSLINIETVWSNEKLSSLDEGRNGSVKQCYGLVYRGVWHHEDKIWRQASRPCQTAFQNSCKLKPGFTSSFFFQKSFPNALNLSSRNIWIIVFHIMGSSLLRPPLPFISFVQFWRELLLKIRIVPRAEFIEKKGVIDYIVDFITSWLVLFRLRWTVFEHQLEWEI